MEGPVSEPTDQIQEGDLEAGGLVLGVKEQGHVNKTKKNHLRPV